MFELNKSFTLEQNSTSDTIKPFNLIWVNPVSFWVGSTHMEETDSNTYPYQMYAYPPFENTISKGYWLGEYPITQAHWNLFNDLSLSWLEGKNYPVYGISWLDAMYYCQKLTEKYKKLVPNGYHFSLPTEVHWEYACKTDHVEQSNPYEILEVGKKSPNNLGFYDMLGGVQEWCFDIATMYPRGKTIDWVGNQEAWWEEDEFLDLEESSREGKYRSIRGGTESYTRWYVSANLKMGTGVEPRVGFRVCLRPITEWDLNDPLLKKNDINMLGKAV